MSWYFVVLGSIRELYFKSLFGTVSMEMTILYLFFVLVKNSRVQEPNVETDHLESSTSGSVNLEL